MPCHSAITEKVMKLSPDDPVEKVLKELKKKKLSYAPVVGKKNEFLGLFSLNVLFQNLLPVSMATSDGLQLGVTVNAAPGIAKRLKKVAPLAVENFMDRKPAAVHPETPIWEGINLIAQQNGKPLVVLDSQSGVFIGMIDEQSALDELQRLQD